MRRKRKHLIFLLVLISIELFIKGMIKIFFSNQIGTKYDISTVIDIYPIVNYEGVSLTKLIGSNYSDFLTILILVLMLSLRNESFSMAICYDYKQYTRRGIYV